MALADLHRRVAQVEVRDAFVRHKVGEGVARLVGQHVDVACGAVPVGKDEGDMVKRQAGAVAAHRLALLGEDVEQVVVEHHPDKLGGLGRHLGVHLLAGLHQLVRGTVRQRIAVREEVGVVVDLHPFDADALGLAGLDFVVDRHNLLDHLAAEVGDLLGAIAVACLQQVGHLDIVGEP